MASSPDTVLAAERAILAACLLDHEAIAIARRSLERKYFFRTSHGTIFDALVGIADRGVEPDLIALADELRERGQLEMVGGPPGLAILMETVGATANVEAHARIVIEHHARRVSREVARTLTARTENGVPPETAIAEAMAGLEQARAIAIPAHERVPTFEEQGYTDAQVLERNAPAPPSLVGDRLIIQGGLTVLASDSGFGKTWIVLQLMDAMARGGIPWLGYTVEDGVSGLLELEMPEGAILDRIKSASEASHFRGRRHFWIQPKGLSAIHAGKTVDDISLAVERRGIRLLAIDSLNKVIPGDKNMEETIEQGFNACFKIIARTGVSILFIHHFNKTQVDAKTNDLAAETFTRLRGSTRLQNDPDTILGGFKRHGRHLLVNAKTRYSPGEGAHIAVRQDPLTGWYSRVESVEETVDKNREKVLKALEFGGDRGQTVEDICRLTKLADRTVRKYLGAIGSIGARMPGRNGGKVFFPPGEAVPEVDFGGGE